MNYFQLSAQPLFIARLFDLSKRTFLSPHIKLGALSQQYLCRAYERAESFFNKQPLERLVANLIDRYMPQFTGGIYDMLIMQICFY